METYTNYSEYNSEYDSDNDAIGLNDPDYLEIKLNKNFSKDKIIGEKNDSSSESNIVKLDTIDFEYNDNIIINQFNYLDKLKSMKFPDIYTTLYMSNMIIFVDDIKINNIKTYFCKKIKKNELPGCTFFAFEFVTSLKQDIDVLNNEIVIAELQKKKMTKDNIQCYSIYFDEGEIKKNCLYKKMEILNKILFVPANKFQIKQTEYKIRGFCQIAEELGAKQIDIQFEKNTLFSEDKKFNANINNEISTIAGNLGLGVKNNKENKEDHIYTLTYPSINTINLNENTIRKKIKKKKFIISETMYNSNLEIQYLISSRCRHFITKYSTTFTIDNNNSIDKSLTSKLKGHGINIGIDMSKSVNQNNYFKIITKVEFSSIEDNNDNLNAYSVSLDKVGFSYLLTSIKNMDNFTENGIFKIMNFLELYIEKVLKLTDNKKYEIVSIIIKQIKMNLSLKEYTEILCNYFNVNSQWIHFTRFIDLLACETVSNDKLGYLVIVYNTNLSTKEKIKEIIKYIQEKCALLNIENKFWKMIQPHNENVYYYLEHKLCHQYDIVKCFNWYSLMNLINCISNYNIDFDNNSNEEYFIKLVNNMNYGYKYYEFYNNILPFIIKRCYIRFNDNKDNYYLSPYIEKSIYYESFISSNINNLHILDSYIDVKINKIKIMDELEKHLIDNINDNKLLVSSYLKIFFEVNDTITKYGYFYKKYNIIVRNNDSERIINDMLDSYTTRSTMDYSNDNSHIIYIKKFLKKLLLYNEKLDINKVPLNNHGLQLILNNYHNGNREYVYNYLITEFVKKYTSYHNMDININYLTPQFINNQCENINDINNLFDINIGLIHNKFTDNNLFNIFNKPSQYNSQNDHQTRFEVIERINENSPIYTTSEKDDMWITQ